MNKKRSFSTLIFTVFLLFLLLLQGFLTYSSVLVEDRLTRIESTLLRMERAVETGDFSSRVVERGAPGVLRKREHLSDSYPNLLLTDPFYEKTLPMLLPKGFRPEGTFELTSIGRPDHLHPFSNWAQVSEWEGLCKASLAKPMVGIYETMTPDLAFKIEKRERKDGRGFEYWVHLRDDAFWRPLSEKGLSDTFELGEWFKKAHPVTAHDVKFFLDAVMNPFVEQPGAVALRNYYQDIEEMEVLDDYTLIIRWKNIEISPGVFQTKYVSSLLTGGLSPLPSFVYQYFADGKPIVEKGTNLKESSVWAQNFNNHFAKNIIVSFGPYVFEEMTERGISFQRNPFFYDQQRALFGRITYSFKETPDSAFLDFKSGRATAVSVMPNQLGELDEFLESRLYETQKEQIGAIKRLDYVTRSYNYIGWNQNTPFFSSRRVRQAMTLLIDRRRIIQDFLDGLGIEISGPFFRFSPSYDSSIAPMPYDPELALRILAEEGWFDSDADGILDKEIDGVRVPFRFTLTYFVKNPVTRSICDFIATSFRAKGILCVLNGVDIADLGAIFEDKSFDAIAMGWSLGTPPEDPRQLWYSKGADIKGSSNAVGFRNEEADKIIDALDFTSDPEERLALYHRFHRIIHEEAPYTFLFTTKAALAFREGLQNVFIPFERQDLIPGANAAEPVRQIFWLRDGTLSH